ncbi:2-oxoglutarate and iron-dependent oxygenase JMJD4-like isoform X2 [Dendronephthya gigantea]|uniref:2-oxoglutarate and iron-dependent oxygenase JMJD4-like isoform X2 n=1 Tax=Dendronephthya gigantea TaxID=151771 RepID=UPI001069FF28|nr:2-oxoglutarate and iron-dependent oxygenase JMJD4-like isoform X2 [Dendronephthya gigantea]
MMEISRVSEIGYQEFVQKYLLGNLPCLLDERFTRNWKSRQEWVCDGKPNFEFLRESFAEATVPVADCDEEEFQSHPKHSMLFKKFIDYWQARSNGMSQDEKCWYLKDWHFCKQFPEYKAYEMPTFFQSDWLNEFWDEWTEMKDDYRFVYMGPKGTWTPFHADVFRSYSWSANICGHKKWILYPPGSENHMKDTHGNLVFDLNSLETQDTKRFPHFHKAPQPMIVHQKEGEIIFVPSCWHHQVMNMVKRSIDDCKEMDGWLDQCQIILEANSGISFATFFKFLFFIARARLHFLEKQFPENSKFREQYAQLFRFVITKPEYRETITSPDISGQRPIQYMYYSRDLCLFDLVKIKDVLEKFLDHEDVQGTLKQDCTILLCCLVKTTDDL